jgi:HD-GYP domain-containing protein (c-di-GMP phosphodiesterase class II)
VLQTVDVYDALATQRPYRKALSREQALEIMFDEVKKGWWDPDLVKQLETLVSNGSPGELPRPEKAAVSVPGVSAGGPLSTSS